MFTCMINTNFLKTSCSFYPIYVWQRTFENPICRNSCCPFEEKINHRVNGWLGGSKLTL